MSVYGEEDCVTDSSSKVNEAGMDNLKQPGQLQCTSSLA